MSLNTYRVDKITHKWSDGRDDRVFFRPFFGDESVEVHFNQLSDCGKLVYQRKPPYLSMEVALLAIEEHKRQNLLPTTVVEQYNENGESLSSQSITLVSIDKPKSEKERKPFGEELDWRMIGAGITVATALWAIVWFLKAV